MKLTKILFLLLTASILIGNSSFSCIGSQKLSVDSVYSVKPDESSFAPRIDIEDFKIDALQIKLPDSTYLFTKQLLQKKLQLVAKANTNRIYAIEYFQIVSATKDSILTNFIYHSYNPKHLGQLAGREFTKNNYTLPIAFIDSFTSPAPYKRK